MGGRQLTLRILISKGREHFPGRNRNQNGNLSYLSVLVCADLFLYAEDGGIIGHPLARLDFLFRSPICRGRVDSGPPRCRQAGSCSMLKRNGYERW
jgi:hypothetical protein